MDQGADEKERLVQALLSVLADNGSVFAQMALDVPNPGVYPVLAQGGGDALQGERRIAENLVALVYEELAQHHVMVIFRDETEPSLSALSDMLKHHLSERLVPTLADLGPRNDGLDGIRAIATRKRGGGPMPSRKPHPWSRGRETKRWK